MEILSKESCQAIPIPLGEKEYKLAKKFRREGEDEERSKAKRVYLNTLAVCAVNFYCQLIGVETDLEQSDTFDLVKRTLIDTADILIKGVGKLECRPVLPEETICSVPPEVREGRIGYLLVEIDDKNCQAKLLGFVEEVKEGKLDRSELRSLDRLIDILIPPIPVVVNLRDWLEKNFALAARAGWKTVAQTRQLLAEGNGYRYQLYFLGEPQLEEKQSPLARVKLINLGRIDCGMALGDVNIALKLQIESESEGKVGVLARVYPAESECLPPNLRIAMLSKSGKLIQEVKSREADNLIQLRRFKGKPGQCFSLQVSLGEAMVTEIFEC